MVRSTPCGAARNRFRVGVCLPGWSHRHADEALCPVLQPNQPLRKSYATITRVGALSKCHDTHASMRLVH
eukprot:4229817-Amphidinium_carterae.3